MDDTAAKRDITITQNADFRLPFNLRDSNQALVDITTWRIVFSLRESYKAKNAILLLDSSVTSPKGAVIKSATSPTIQVTMPESTTSTLKLTRGVYDIMCYPEGADSFMLMKGVAVLQRSASV